ncbi:MAG: hypothetical protein NZ889_00560 [Candidatus Pacearchaeota archaeon]|nr:hypothetical protein [Candidatus Pacearchaeota archaeon]
MSFKELLKKVESSKEFYKFKKNNPTAKLYSAFFTFRKAFGNLLVECEQIDYLVGKTKIKTFFMQNDEVKSKQDILERPVENFQALKKNIKVDIKDIEKILAEEMKKQKIFSEIQEVVAILQRHENKQVWNIIVILSSLDMLRLHIDMDGKILLSKKENLMNLMQFKSQ